MNGPLHTPQFFELGKLHVYLYSFIDSSYDVIHTIQPYIFRLFNLLSACLIFYMDTPSFFQDFFFAAKIVCKFFHPSFWAFFCSFSGLPWWIVVMGYTGAVLEFEQLRRIRKKFIEKLQYCRFLLLLLKNNLQKLLKIFVFVDWQDFFEDYHIFLPLCYSQLLKVTGWEMGCLVNVFAYTHVLLYCEKLNRMNQIFFAVMWNGSALLCML